MKKLSITAAALMVAAQIAPAQTAPPEVEILRSVMAAVDAANAAAVRDLLAAHPEIQTFDPVLADKLLQFVAAPRPNPILRSLGFRPTVQREAYAATFESINSIY